MHSTGVGGVCGRGKHKDRLRPRGMEDSVELVGSVPHWGEDFPVAKGEDVLGARLLLGTGPAVVLSTLTFLLVI